AHGRDVRSLYQDIPRLLEVIPQGAAQPIIQKTKVYRHVRLRCRFPFEIGIAQPRTTVSGIQRSGLISFYRIGRTEVVGRERRGGISSRESLHAPVGAPSHAQFQVGYKRVILHKGFVAYAPPGRKGGKNSITVVGAEKRRSIAAQSC